MSQHDAAVRGSRNALADDPSAMNRYMVWFRNETVKPVIVEARSAASAERAAERTTGEVPGVTLEEGLGLDLDRFPDPNRLRADEPHPSDRA